MELSTYSQDGSISLYFVLPPKLSPDDCTKLLKYSYQACQEHDLSPKWLKAEDCMQMNPTKQDVFICDPFDGPAFNFLSSNDFKCVILGPRCLLKCLHNKRPVPELPSPLHNMAMDELVVTSTGFGPEEKAELQQLVKRMSGIYSNDFHECITHLVAKLVGSKKYQAAVEKNTPIMSEEWVKAVWKVSQEESGEMVSATDSKFAQFTCPIFRGLVICVSQMPRSEKNALKKLIEDNGGEYSPNLEMPRTSVLISPIAEGEKFSSASKWRVTCLTPEWIQDSVENRIAMPFDNYRVVKGPKASTPTKDSTAKIPPDVSVCSTIANVSYMNASHVNETVVQELTLALQPKKLDTRITAGVQTLKDLHLASYLKSSCDLFLDGCKIFICGFEESLLNDKIRKILKVGGATRFNHLNDSVTHVVVGKQVPEDVSALSKPKVVSAEWLVDCVKQCCLVETERYSLLENTITDDYTDHFKKPLARPSISSDTLVEDRTILAEDKTIIDDPIMSHYLNNDGSVPNNDSTNDYSTLPDSQASQCPGGIFKGQTISVSGYDEEITEQLISIIRDNGGIIVDPNSLCLRINYSIVSILSEGFFAPNSQHYVTYLFIEECIQEEALLPVRYHHLPFACPPNCNILSDCTLAFSTYAGNERKFITEVSCRMGATYQDMFAKKDNPKKDVLRSTHLICPLPEGSKFTAAKKWDVPAISKDWLFKCALKGERVPEQSFSVDDNPEEIDCTEVLLILLRRSGKVPNHSKVFSGLSDKDIKEIPQTPLNNNIRNLSKEGFIDLASIVTPDLETMRKMYPTPGRNIPKSTNSDEMPTPDTPYGRFLYGSDPPAHIRKAFKRALDAIPDDKPIPEPAETPVEVIFKRYLNKAAEIARSGSPELERKAPIEQTKTSPNLAKNASEDTTVLVETPAGMQGPLTGVIVCTSRKLLDVQNELYRTVSALGGDYRWSYDASVTHFVHTGRLNDTNKEFRVAREQGKIIVAPDWVWMCRDEKSRIDEALFPHTHNPKLTLSIVSTKATPVRKAKRAKTKNVPEEPQTHDEGQIECGNEGDNDKNPEVPQSSEDIAQQIEELKLFANTTQSSRKAGPSLGTRVRSFKDTPTSHSNADHQCPTGTTEPESQGTEIGWDDLKDREARVHLGDMNAENIQEAEYTTNLIDGKSNYVFAFSGMSDEERGQMISGVEYLGGSWRDCSKNFDLSVTHVVTTKLTRSEKHLAAIASGKWIVYKTFVEASLQACHFVDESEHEWGNPKAFSLPMLQKDSMASVLARAAHKWRAHVESTGRGVYSGMRFAVHTSSERISSFKSLIEAGDGLVVEKPQMNISNVTHCLVEMNKDPKVDLALYANHSVPCLPPIYLNNFLISDTPPDVDENCIPEYKEIIENLTSCEKSMLKVTRK